MTNGHRALHIPCILLLASTTFAVDKTTDFSGMWMLKARTRWNKSNLVIDGSQQVTSSGRDFVVKIKQELSLPKNGQVLTIKTSRTLPSGPVTIKQTFKRSP